MAAVSPPSAPLPRQLQCGNGRLRWCGRRAGGGGGGSFLARRSERRESYGGEKGRRSRPAVNVQYCCAFCTSRHCHLSRWMEAVSHTASRATRRRSWRGTLYERHPSAPRAFSLSQAKGGKRGWRGRDAAQLAARRCSPSSRTRWGDAPLGRRCRASGPDRDQHSTCWRLDATFWTRHCNFHRVVPVSSIATGSIAVDYGNLVARPRADAETWRCTAATTATIQCLWTRHDERYSADDGGRLSGRDEDEKRGTAAGHWPTGWPDSARRGGRGGGIMQMRERGAARGHGRNKFRRPTRTPGDGGAKFGGRPRGVVRAGKGRGRDAQECHQCVPRASPPPLHSAC